jgi:hypothetical protein
MFGQITDLPHLRSYEQALKHYESIKPIRGSDNVRPICATPNGRRKKHMQIIKGDGLRVDKDAIACRLYDTDVLTFYKDGVVEYFSGGWISNSTHLFASKILYAVDFRSRLDNTEVYIGYRKIYHVPPKKTFRMKREGDTWVAIDPPKIFEFYLKRKEYNAKRKPLKEFEAHCIRMTKLCDPKEKQSELHSVWEGLSNSPKELGWFHLDTYKDLTLHYHKDLVDGSSSWGRLVPLMLEHARTYGSPWDREHRNTYYFDTQKIKEAINDMVKYAFADELFEERETTKRTFNGNEKFVWDKYKGGRE